MMTEDRYTAILEALKEKKSMTVAEFTEITGASEGTAQRQREKCHCTICGNDDQ